MLLFGMCLCFFCFLPPAPHFFFSSMPFFFFFFFCDISVIVLWLPSSQAISLSACRSTLSWICATSLQMAQQEAGLKRILFILRKTGMEILGRANFQAVCAATFVSGSLWDAIQPHLLSTSGGCISTLQQQ